MLTAFYAAEPCVSKHKHSGDMQAAITRAKAVKALGAVVQASQRLLKVPEVQESVSNALQVRGASYHRMFSCTRVAITLNRARAATMQLPVAHKLTT